MSILSITVDKEDGTIVIRNSADKVIYSAMYRPDIENIDTLIRSTVEMAIRTFM